jgi:hypothetical protein
MCIGKREVGVENANAFTGLMKGEGEIDGEVCLADSAFSACDGRGLRTFHITLPTLRDHLQ